MCPTQPACFIDQLLDRRGRRLHATLTLPLASPPHVRPPGCGHCKHLVPHYSKLGAAIAKDPKLRSRVLIAKVDADAHRSLGERFGVRGFPTIKWFPRGKAAAPEE